MEDARGPSSFVSRERVKWTRREIGFVILLPLRLLRRARVYFEIEAGETLKLSAMSTRVTIDVIKDKRVYACFVTSYF